MSVETAKAQARGAPTGMRYGDVGTQASSATIAITTVRLIADYVAYSCRIGAAISP